MYIKIKNMNPSIKSARQMTAQVDITQSKKKSTKKGKNLMRIGPMVTK
jgi:hypothetical protein